MDWGGGGGGGGGQVGLLGRRGATLCVKAQFD